ncbi:MAG: hypothetical protein LBE35_08405 [Clostridiales bacterium]|jgi:hypothetical protein|nr:hypothetical protein [Clostridiales bacterium]
MSNVKSPAVEKKGKAGLIALIAFVLVVGGLVAMVAFNVFGLRDNVVMPFLRNVPLVGDFVPGAEEVEGGEVYDPTIVLLEQIDELRAQNSGLQERLDVAENFVNSFEDDMTAMYNTISENELELERLREMERDHARIAANREAFERGVIEGNLDAFMEFFETVHPDLAEEIYTRETAHMVAGYRRQHYLDVWTVMSPIAIGRAIEADNMAATDMPLLVSVFRDLPEATVARILENVSEPTRTAILRQMYTP